MTTTLLKETLKTALGIVSKAATNKVMPILGSVRLEATELSLSLTATDLETAIHTIVPANCEKPFTTCAPAAVLTSLVQTSDAAQIQFKPQDGEKLLLVAGGAKSTLHCLPAADFPPLPNTGFEMGVVPANTLRTALKRVLVAASNDQARPVLCAVQIARIQDKTYLAAADGFRLAAYRLDEELQFPGKPSVVIPRGAAIKLAAILPESDEPVALSITKNSAAVGFAWQGMKVWTQVLDYPFPDWTAIIPTSFKHDLYLPGKQAAEAILRAEVFSRNGSNTVCFAPNETGMNVLGESNETGRSETRLDVAMPFQIRFNAVFARQGLEAIAADSIRLRINAANAPALFTNPSNSGASGTDRYLYLLMPMVTVEDEAIAAKAAAAAVAQSEVME